MASLVDDEGLLFLWKKKYALKVTGTIHVGAHLVQERFFYQKNNFEPVLWVEAMPEIAKSSEAILSQFDKQKILNAVLWSANNVELTFHHTSGEGASSSAFDLFIHKAVHPNVEVVDIFKVTTTTLDSIVPEDFPANLLIMDTQGSELEILKGGKNSLNKIDYIVSELSIKQLYKNAPKLDQIQNFLQQHGFTLVAAEINRTVGWGDGLFIRTSFLEKNGFSNEQKAIHFVGPKYTAGTFLRAFAIRTGTLGLLHRMINR